MFSAIVNIRRSYLGYLGELTHLIDVKSKTIKIYNPKYENKTIAFVENLKENGLGEYIINADYPK